MEAMPTMVKKMAKKKTTKTTMVKPRHSQTDAATADKPIALTLKIDSDLYVRWATLRAKERRSHQEILKQALEEYLDRVGA
jgi:hypothetical protein